jgi:hypothetical protein
MITAGVTGSVADGAGVVAVTAGATCTEVAAGVSSKMAPARVSSSNSGVITDVPVTVADARVSGTSVLSALVGVGTSGLAPTAVALKTGGVGVTVGRASAASLGVTTIFD